MKRADVLPERVQLLNIGQTEARNLVESLVIDFNSLLSHALPKAKLPLINNSDGILKRMQAAARVINDQFGVKSLELLYNHPSDTVRGWLCYIIALQNLDFKESMELIKPL